MNDIRVLNPGLYSSFQDLGRKGWRAQGIPPSGAMDQKSFRDANDLLGNVHGEAVLEITLLGPTLEFLSDLVVVITGADLSAKINGSDFPLYRPVQVTGGDVLKFGRPILGSRAYLGVAGGFELESGLGSRSTFELANLGPAVLKKGEVLDVKNGARKDLDPFKASRRPDFKREIITAHRGPEFDSLSEEARSAFRSTNFEISNDSNRMAYRLVSENWKGEDIEPILSSVVFPGTIQLPPKGSPILLMRDCQSTGGYPRIAQVQNRDLDILAQKKPGDKIRINLL